MIGRPKKQPPVQRSPHINRQKQPAFHYSSNRSQTERTLARHDTQANDVTEKKNKFFNRFKRWPYLLGALLTVFIIFYFSILSAKPVLVIKDSGAPMRDTALYASAASDLTSDLQSRSKLTLNRQKITSELQNRFPELSRAEVITPFFARSVTIELQTQTPELLINDGSDTYLVDSRGVVLLNMKDIDQAFSTDKLTTVSDQSNSPIEVGKPALTSAQVNFILQLRHQSEAKQLTIESLNLTAGAGELIARYKELPYFIKFNLGEDARKSFGTFYATKEYTESSKAQPSEYIDVRIPERAFVK